MDPETFELTELELDRVDLVTAGANPGAHVLIAKFDIPATLSDKTVETPDVQPPEVDTQMAENVQDAVETISKADYEAVAKRLDEMSKALADVQAEKVAADEQVAKMERAAKVAEFVAKAADFSNLGKADELGGLLLAASESFSAEQYQALERMLKAANAQVETGDLFAQFAQPEAEALDAAGKVDALAKAKVDAGTAKTLQIAKLEVLRENRELAAEYSHATRVS